MAGKNSAGENKNALTLGNIKTILDIMALIGIPISWGWWSSLPTVVHVILYVSIGGWILFRFLFFIRKKIVEYRESKQEEEEVPLGFFLNTEPRTGYHSKWKEFEGFQWNVVFHLLGSRLEDIEGPCCPDDHTKLIAKQTFLGKYQYECPACSFGKKHYYNVYTLEKRMERVIQAELNTAKEERIRRQNKVYGDISEKIKTGFKNMWDDV